MGYSNTSATLDAGSATMVNVPSSTGGATADVALIQMLQGGSHAHHVFTAHLQP